MKRLGNTLYVTSQGSYLSKDGDCVLIARELKEYEKRCTCHETGAPCCAPAV